MEKQFKNSLDFYEQVNKDKLTNLKTKIYSNENIDEVKNKTSEFLPKYHLSSKAGLINDPNGLHQDNDGIYYIYYQMSPLYPAHFMKHWGLYTTKDFIKYKDEGVVIKPDFEFDKDGVYSGAASKENGKVHIFYTGNLVGEDGTDKTRGATTIYYDKLSKEKRLLFEVDKEKYTGHFRDPAPFEKNNKKYLIHGAQTKELKGALSVYESDSWEKDWTLKGNLKIKDLDDSGHMLECPNLITIDNKELLFFSVQGSNQFDNYLPIDIVVYGIGNFNEDTLEFDNNGIVPIDYGFDFYAPQLFKDNKERVIMFGWLGNGFNLEYIDANDGYNGVLTLPRELKIQNGNLIQYPVKEICDLAKDELLNLNNINHKQLLINIKNIKDEWEFNLFNKDNKKIKISYLNNQIIFDRTSTSKNEEKWILKDGRKESNIIKIDIENLNEIDLFIDSSTLEMFVNKGEKAFASRFYLKNEWNINNDNSEIKIYKY